MTNPSAKASSPHRMAGPRALASPARPGSLSPGSAVTTGFEPPPSATGGGAAEGAARVWLGPSTAWTTSRCDAVNRGVQVVRVSRLSGVGSTTDTSLGLTALDDTT